MVIVNLIVRGFITRVREKFLKLDLDTLADVGKASAALTGGDRFDLSGDENAFVNGLQPNALMDRCALANGNEALPELLRGGNHEIVLTHLSGAPHKVADIDRERQFLVFTHTYDSTARGMAHLHTG